SAEEKRQAFGLRGRAAELTSNYRMAWGDYKKVLKLMPNERTAEPAPPTNADALAERRIWLSRRGWVALTPVVREWMDANDSFAELLESDPHDPHALAGLACAQLRIGLFEKARETIDQAVKNVSSQDLSSEGRSVEVRRRVYHAKADV